MKKTIIVVEGMHDEHHLKTFYPGIETISVGGSAVDQHVLEFLVNYQNVLDIILLFDPDFPGEKIRKKVAEKLQSPKHIYVDQKVAKSKKKIGIEHMSKKDLDEAFKHVVLEKHVPSISKKDFVDLGLEGQNGSRALRDMISFKLHLGGNVNAKTLFKRLNFIGITKETLQRIMDGTSI